MFNPCGVAVSSAGDVVFADSYNNRIRVLYAASGTISTLAGSGVGGFSGDGGPATSAALDSPRGLTVGASGDVWIADNGSRRIRKLSAATGLISTVAGSSAQGYSGDGGPATSAGLQYPSSVALGAAGDLWIVDQGDHRIRRVAASTAIISTVAGRGVPGFSGDGEPATSAQLFSPQAVALDGAGDAWIADTANHRIRRLAASTGIISTVAGTGEQGFSGDGGPATSAALWIPSGVAVHTTGDVFIVENFNHRVRVLSAATGIIMTVAGVGVEGFSGDGGPGTSAQLKYPYGIAVDQFGNVFVSDNGNNRIRMLAGPASASRSPSATPSWSPTCSLTAALSPSAAPSPSVSASPTATASPTRSVSMEPSDAASASRSATPAGSSTPALTRTPSSGPTPSAAAVMPSPSPSGTRSAAAASSSGTPAATATPSARMSCPFGTADVAAGCEACAWPFERVANVSAIAAPSNSPPLRGVQTPSGAATCMLYDATLASAGQGLSLTWPLLPGARLTSAAAVAELAANISGALLSVAPPAVCGAAVAVTVDAAAGTATARLVPSGLFAAGPSTGVWGAAMRLLADAAAPAPALASLVSCAAAPAIALSGSGNTTAASATPAAGAIAAGVLLASAGAALALRARRLARGRTPVVRPRPGIRGAAVGDGGGWVAEAGEGVSPLHAASGRSGGDVEGGPGPPLRVGAASAADLRAPGQARRGGGRGAPRRERAAFAPVAVH